MRRREAWRFDVPGARRLRLHDDGGRAGGRIGERDRGLNDRVEDLNRNRVRGRDQGDECSATAEHEIAAEVLTAKAVQRSDAGDRSKIDRVGGKA